MAKTDNFFQFPLCLLQCEHDDPADLCADVVAWTLVEKGRSVYERDEFFVDVDEIPPDADPACDAHRWIVVMAETMMLPLDVGDLSTYVDRHERAREHVDEYLSRVRGGDMEVRVRDDLIEQVRDGQMPPRQFRVLAGLYAAIGAHKYRRVSLKHLRYLSAGFKSEAAYRAAGDDRPLLTKRQVQYTRDKLLDTRWLFRYHDGRRNYYSNRLNDTKLAEEVTRQKRRNEEAREERRMAEEVAKKRQQIATAKEKLARKRKLEALDAELAALEAELEANVIHGDGQLPVVQPSDPEGRKGG